jgi:hypothetical protein
MPTHRQVSVITLVLALAGAGLACRDDPPAANAGATGGRGGATGGGAGSGGKGGTGGTRTGGSAGTGSDGSAGSDATTGAADGGTDTAGTGGTGVTADAGDAAGTGGAGGTAGAGGAGGTGGSIDAAVDVPKPVDLPPDLPPDMNATTVQVTQCSQINCPGFTSVVNQCAAFDASCTYETSMELPQKHTNYCHSNGVKKAARTVYSGNAYTTTMEVQKANGDDCYTLVIAGTGGTADVQTWTYKNPAGATVGTASWTASNGQLTIRCDGVNYVIGNIGCPGTDGQPDDGNDCTSASCDL